MGDILLVTGDSSSDRYAAKLINFLKSSTNYSGTIYAAAGYQSKQAGAELVENVVDRAVVGLTEIVSSIPYFLDLLSKLEDIVDRRNIKAVLLMDFPGFNLRFAKRIKDRTIPMFYYITPQVWAWGRHRVEKLNNWFEKLFVIFPFEEDFFRERGGNAEFVGHPLLDELKDSSGTDVRNMLELKADKRIVSFFPGSRDHEIDRHLRPMAETAMRVQKTDRSLFPVISAAPTVDQSRFTNHLTDRMINELPVWNGNSFDLLKESLFTVLASGTITMEAAFAETPMIVGYKLSWLTYWIGKFLVRTKQYAMPNLLHNDLDIPEFIQSDFAVDNLTSAVSKYTRDRVLRAEQREKLTEIRKMFEEKDPAEIVGKRLLSRVS